MTEFLYVIRPTRAAMLTDGPTPEEERIVGEHFAYLQDWCTRGVVQMAGRSMSTGADALGLVILAVDSKGQAEEFMLNDPAVRGGVMSSTLHDFRAALRSREWGG